MWVKANALVWLIKAWFKQNRCTLYSTSGLSVDLRQTGQIGPDLENAMGSRRVRFRQAWSSQSSQPCAERKRNYLVCRLRINDRIFLLQSWSSVMHASKWGCGPQETGGRCVACGGARVRPGADAAAPRRYCLSCPCYYSGGQGVMWVMPC